MSLLLPAKSGQESQSRRSSVYRAPRSEDGSKRKVIHITSNSQSTRRQILTKCVVARPTFSQSSPHPGVVAGWGPVDVCTRGRTRGDRFICLWTLNLIYPQAEKGSHPLVRAMRKKKEEGRRPDHTGDPGPGNSPVYVFFSRNRTFVPTPPFLKIFLSKTLARSQGPS